MIALALRYWQLGAGAAAGALIGWAATFAYIEAVTLPQARTEGREAERAAALQKSMDLIKERGRTDAEINSLDTPALCRELGGVWMQSDDVCE